MIPYFELPYLDLGFRAFPPFGLLISVAILVGIGMGVLRGRKLGLDLDILTSYQGSILVSGLLFSHLATRLVYNPAATFANPRLLLDITGGMSSYGGFFGAILGALIYNRVARKRGVTDVWPYLESAAWGFPFGWIFGRLGCFVVFDHPGTPTTFFLGHEDKEGIVRHDLGFYEVIFTVGLSIAFLWLGRKSRPPAFFLAVMCLSYAPIRFAMDSLRVVDVRVLGMTPGMIASVLLFGIGLALLKKARAAT